MYKHGGRRFSVKAVCALLLYLLYLLERCVLLSCWRPHVSNGRLCACAVIIDAAVVCAQRAISDADSVASAPTRVHSIMPVVLLLYHPRAHVLSACFSRGGQKGHLRYLYLLYDARSGQTQHLADVLRQMDHDFSGRYSRSPARIQSLGKPIAAAQNSSEMIPSMRFV